MMIFFIHARYEEKLVSQLLEKYNIIISVFGKGSVGPVILHFDFVPHNRRRQHSVNTLTDAVPIPTWLQFVVTMI